MRYWSGPVPGASPPPPVGRGGADRSGLVSGGAMHGWCRGAGCDGGLDGAALDEHEDDQDDLEENRQNHPH